MRHLIAASFIAVLVLGCGAAGNSIAGSFTLSDSHIAWTPNSCSGTSGYSDIRPGLGVTIKDQTGTVIATSSLVLDPAGSSAGQCRFTWTVPVGKADFYVVSVGHRGDLTYAYADMVARSWKVDATLGS